MTEGTTTTFGTIGPESIYDHTHFGAPLLPEESPGNSPREHGAEEETKSFVDELIDLDDEPSSPRTPQFIQGLVYIPNFMTDSEVSEISRFLNEREWFDVGTRQVQHYGYKFHYRHRHTNILEKLTNEYGRMPRPCVPVLRRMASHHLVPRGITFDQCIVNKYPPSAGIKPHLDRINCFEEYLVTLSIGGPVVMDFCHTITGEVRAILLEPNSLLILSGEARYQWRHGILQQSTHKYRGKSIRRTERISLTFRKVANLGTYIRRVEGHKNHYVPVRGAHRTRGSSRRQKRGRPASKADTIMLIGLAVGALSLCSYFVFRQNSKKTGERPTTDK